MIETRPKVLALIPARGGSVGLPRKNVMPLGGRPLIGWTIRAALGARSIDRVVVSTDDPEIRDVALAEGADVPFLRPAEFATSTASSVDVVRHALGELPGFDRVVLLQPTSPQRTSDDIDAASALMNETGAHSCTSVCEVEQSPHLMYSLDPGGRLERLLPPPPRGLRRQDLPTIYRLNGALYAVDVDWFLRIGAFVTEETVAYVMPDHRSVDIDTAEDFALAERRMAEDGDTEGTGSAQS